MKRIGLIDGLLMICAGISMLIFAFTDSLLFAIAAAALFVCSGIVKIIFGGKE